MVVAWQVTDAGDVCFDFNMFFPTKAEAVSHVRENGDLEEIQSATYTKIVVNNRQDLAQQLNLAMGFG